MLVLRIVWKSLEIWLANPIKIVSIITQTACGLSPEWFIWFIFCNFCDFCSRLDNGYLKVIRVIWLVIRWRRLWPGETKGCDTVGGGVLTLYNATLCNIMPCETMWHGRWWGAHTIHFAYNVTLYNVTLCDVKQCDTVGGVLSALGWCHTIQYDTVWCDTIQCDAVKCHTVCAMWCAVWHCKMWRGAVLCDTVRWRITQIPIPTTHPTPTATFSVSCKTKFTVLHFWSI